MHIANPMYDTVFKYLLEDNALAKLLIGTILQEDILSLEFCPQERTQQIERPGKRVLTVYRMDFAARVRNVEGIERQVLIELQKAKFATDILRFRRYLGAQYRDPENIRMVTRESGDQTREGIPILTIYFLGHALEHSEAPVIHVRRDCVDLASGQSLAQAEPFIESLTHDSYVIQIPKLKGQRRTAVEEMLQLFDQSRTGRDRHYLSIDEQDIPPEYRPLLRRLQQAAAEPEIADAMELEDEILEELQDIERKLEQAEERVEAALARAEVEQARAEAALARAEVEQARAEAEHEEKERLLHLLKAAGIDPEGAEPSTE
ncbi:PD-(D/E)XK nuclease family transposase [Thiorhodovibrio winogradskyi]|uniref:PD-(D/E)XK nuclease family transposase n=1 Tax=Thiorhodovibrio winogradskyi TaxID=77007 RepID=A0ABZ0SHW3_9GAMM|nr:hypothetical protein [Thiorhodovibrio winogradskyi]